MDSLTSAVAAVITDPGGRVLLCRQSQGHQLWGLPSGRIQHCEHPAHAVVRDVQADTGLCVDVVDLVGLYRLTGTAGDGPLPDVVVHVFRARVTGGEASVNAPARISRLGWYDPHEPPEPLTATVRQALADATAGRSGVLADVHRFAEAPPIEAAS
ncbi:MAG TPA: NUDIX domain-containing protein [Actinocatenispora sp.]